MEKLLVNNMDFLEAVKLTIVSLKANKVRSFLTMLGIIIGVSAVILLVSLGSGLQRYITSTFEDLGSNTLYVLPGQVGQEGQSITGPPNFSGSKLTLNDSRDIKKLGLPIVDVGASNENSTSIKYGNISKYVQIHGITENFLKMSNINIVLGRDLTKADIDQERKVVILGNAIADKLFNGINPLGKKVLMGDFRYEVVGIMEKKGGGLGASLDDVPFIPITSYQRHFNSDKIQAISIAVQNKESIPEAKAMVEKFFLKRLKKDEFSVVDQASLVTTINSIIGVLTAALGGIAGISLLVGGIGIMNIMLVSVTERTKEIGLRKAVGATSKDILFQFLTEAITLCLIGGGIGILLGAGGALLAQKVIPTEVPLWSVILAFGFSAMVGIVFGVAPAIKAAKLDPIVALRYE